MLGKEQMGKPATVSQPASRKTGEGGMEPHCGAVPVDDRAAKAMRLQASTVCWPASTK